MEIGYRGKGKRSFGLGNWEGSGVIGRSRGYRSIRVVNEDKFSFRFFEFRFLRIYLGGNV